jgi:hypothetical protein
LRPLARLESKILLLLLLAPLALLERKILLPPDPSISGFGEIWYHGDPKRKKKKKKGPCKL